MVLNVSPFGPTNVVPRGIEGTELLYSVRFFFACVNMQWKAVPRDMTNVQMLEIQEAGSDYLLLHGGGMRVRINFAHNEEYSKEECAAFFRGMEGKEAAIPTDFSEPFFIALDFWWGPDNSARVMPITFAVSTLELLVGGTSRTLVICPVHRIQMRETAEADVPGILFFYCPHPAGCDRRFSKEIGHITIDDLPCRSSGSAHLMQ